MRMVVNNNIGVEIPRKKNGEGNPPPSVNVLFAAYVRRTGPGYSDFVQKYQLVHS